MPDDLVIRSAVSSVPGNKLLIYLAARKLQQILGTGRLANISLPAFGIQHPDEPVAGRQGLHVPPHGEVVTQGRIFAEDINKAYRNKPFDLINLGGYCQNVHNFPDNIRLDDEAGVPAGGLDDELVISIRGDETFPGLHPHYTLLPVNFIADVIRDTGLRPVFFGHIIDNAYGNALRARFPQARFLVSKDMAYDFAFLRRSKNILLSINAYAWAAAWLSGASRIIFPISGFFHPNQHRTSFLLPLDDPRYEYYLFPFNYGIPADRFAEADAAMDGLWRKVSPAEVRNTLMMPTQVPKRLDSYLAAFDPVSYARRYQIQTENRERHGDIVLLDDYLRDGFAAGRDPFLIDRAWYCRAYPQAAFDIGRNTYADEAHHFIEAGRHQGFHRTAHEAALAEARLRAARPGYRRDRIAACLTVKNEAFRIREWLAYHRAIGFDAFIIFDNMSTDGTGDIVKQAAETLDIKYVLWDRQDWFYQVHAYAKALEDYKDTFDWIAFIDSDEFIVLHDDEDMAAFMARFTDASAVVLNWAMFGSSGHEERPEGLLIESFTRRAPITFYMSRLVKSIVRPRDMAGRPCNHQHVFDVTGRTVDVLGEVPVWEKLANVRGAAVYDVCQLNHYYVKSRAEWFAKMRRGYHDLNLSHFDDAKFGEGFRHADHNEVFDDSALRFLDGTRAVLQELGS